MGVKRGGLRARDLSDVARVLPVALAVALGLRVLSLPALTRRLGIALRFDPPAPGLAGMAAAQSGQATADRGIILTQGERRALIAVRRLYARLPGSGHCLPATLVLCRLIPRAVGRVGVRREDGRILAHAWIEVEGVPLEPATHAFVPLRRAQRHPGTSGETPGDAHR